MRIDVQLITNLAERMTANIKEEIRSEVLQEARASGSDAQATMEALNSHTCPVCMSVMTNKQLSQDHVDHSPMLIFPCGHTLCVWCTTRYIENLQKRKCPYCRGKIEKIAINRPLLEMITSIADGKQQQASPQESTYSQMYHQCCTRHAILSGELVETQKELLDEEEAERCHKKALTVLEEDESRLQKELFLVRETLANMREKTLTRGEQCANLRRRQELVKSTLTSLDESCAKYKLLAQHEKETKSAP
eukprot:GEMP01088344.1.p1 GENE.GEMP01088344.1~~GEMP01088344.1.p1  ORF type:complete len:249 (+),score=66.36 GEMP01088344.1:208-954(+)